MRSALLRTFAILLTLAPTAAFAHTGAGYVHGFADGFAHPLGGLDHILAMVTVGVLAWQLGGRAVWFVPGSFLALMAIGGALGIAGAMPAWVEVGIAASVLAFGMMVAFGLKAPLAVAVGIVGLFAGFHGYAHGAAMPAAASAGAYAAGFIVATTLLLAAGIGLGFLIGRLGASYGWLAYRLGGCLVALAGTGILLHVI
jgi:urease accessory protein